MRIVRLQSRRRHTFFKVSRAHGVFMEVTALRSALQHACSELGNLTNVELTEGKWPTKKKVFEQLIAKSPSLVDQHEELNNLIDDRNSESSRQKRDGVSRDERIESESQFRTKFMRIVLDGLQRVRWPPAQEAFSDPLDALFNDVSTFIDAVTFLLHVAVPSGTRSLFSSSQQRQSTPPKTPKSSTGRTEKTISPGMSVFDTSISMISNTSIYAEEPDAAVPVRTSVPQSARGDGLSPRPSSFANFDAPEQLEYNAKDRKVELNWKAFEVLQRQNEVLSSRLQELQMSVLKRDETEAKIAGVLVELRNSIGEIVEAGGSSSKGKTTSAVEKGGTSLLRAPADTSTKGISAVGTAALSNEEEMEVFRLEVEREKQEELAKKDKSLGISTAQVGKGGVSGNSAKGRPPITSLCTNCSGRLSSKANTPSFTTPEQSGSSGVIWSKLLARIRALEDQWTGTQRVARRLAEGVGGAHGLGSSPRSNPRRSSGGSSSSGGLLYSAGNTPSRSLSNHVLGVQPALFGAASEDCAFQGADIFASPPQPPSGRSTAGGDGAGAHNFGMDLARIHLLQRDLVAFAEQAFGWTSDCVFPEASLGGSDPSQHPDVIPPSLSAARRQQRALDMHLAASDLVLHLSCVSPVAPLALCSPFRSCLTGLDALIHEMTELAFPKLAKSSQMRLQAAADRALAEQLAVIRCWRQARSCLMQWTQHASTVTPALRALGQRFKASVDHTARELQDKTETLRQLLLALDTAESARVRPSASAVSADDCSVASAASNRSAPPISPLDSLVRGSAGKEVSALVSALRMHRDDLDGMAQSVRGLGSRLSGELRRELELLSTTEINVASATDATLSMLHSSLPGQQADAGTVTHGKGGRVRRVAEGTAGSTKRAQSSSSGAGSSAKVSSQSLGERPPFDLSLS